MRGALFLQPSFFSRVSSAGCVVNENLLLPCVKGDNTRMNQGKLSQRIRGRGRRVLNESTASEIPVYNSSPKVVNDCTETYCRIAKSRRSITKQLLLRRVRVIRLFLRKQSNPSLLLYFSIALFVTIWRTMSGTSMPIGLKQLPLGHLVKRRSFPKQIYVLKSYSDIWKGELASSQRVSHLLPRRRLPTNGTDLKHGDIELDHSLLSAPERTIQHEFEEGTIYVKTSKKLKKGGDASKGEPEVSTYYAFDDDIVRSTFISERRRCRRTSWHRLAHPNCNSFHELDILENSGQVLGHGYYRVVFGFQESNSHDQNNHGQSFVIKSLRYDRKYDHEHAEYARMDALVMERLTSSPRIVDAYGYCGFSVATENVPNEVESRVIHGSGYIEPSKLDDKDDVRPLNSLTPKEKLEVALSMAEALADLHGFKDGVIVHDDVQLSQFLVTQDGQLKLNDFNRAEAMLWDIDNEEYCKYYNGYVFGNYRSPEEDQDMALNEKIDVYSLGNNFYSILTGLWIHYDVQDDTIVQKRVINCQKPYIDERYKTRSHEESALVTVMEKCLACDPDERVDIFSVVEYLRRVRAALHH